MSDYRLLFTDLVTVTGGFDQYALAYMNALEHPAQYSHTGYANWLVKKHPAIAAILITELLETISNAHRRADEDKKKRGC